MRALAFVLLASCAAAQRPRANRSLLGPLLLEAIRFPTVAGNEKARADQEAWLLRTASSLGLVARPQGPVTEIELPAPEGAPVLGLVVHGDVQPVDERQWTAPPFAGVMRGDEIVGRGAADDKGPMVQALLAMAELEDVPRTHAIRLLVGSDEESGSSDMKRYLAGHQPPDYSLVLDSEFPVVVGEKAWDALMVLPRDEAPGTGRPWSIEDIDAGLAPSIVPDRARITLRWVSGPPSWDDLLARLEHKPLDRGTRLEAHRDGERLELTMHGRGAHAGVNIEGGRNALVSLARVLGGELPSSATADLLAFAAAQDVHARPLDLPAEPGWGGWTENVAVLRRSDKAQNRLALIINLRRPPPLDARASREALFARVRAFSPRLEPRESFFGDEPLVFDRNGRLVRRLMDAYARATGERPPAAISGGGTYAKRIPNAIAFGMWFPGKPYPGHDVDEHISLEDLQRGLDVLVETLRDIATGPRIEHPFQP